MNSIKSFLHLLIAMSLVLYIAVTSTLSTAAQAPLKRLDDATRRRGRDPEAGAIGTTEIVIFAAIVLVVVVTVATGFTEKIQAWFDRVPGGQ